MRIVKNSRNSKGNSTLRGSVYDRIKLALAEGEIGPTDVITEREFADRLGVSRTPVREALALLAHEGLLIPTGRGFSMPDFTEGDISHIYHVRRLLEPEAVALSAHHLSAHALERLAEALEEQKRTHQAKDVDSFVRANDAFRRVWLNAVPNPYLRSAIERYDGHVSWLRQATLFDGPTRGRVLQSLEKLLDALKRGDKTAATAVMQEHLSTAEAVLRKAFEKRPAAWRGAAATLSVDPHV